VRASLPDQVSGQQIISRSSHLEDKPRSCYKLVMPKITQQWLLFKYVAGEFTPLSKPFKTKQQAEKARSKYPERQRKTIAIGMIRLKK
jgi:hypothetical protein